MGKRWLTRNEERESLRYARILLQEGVKLDIPDEWLEHFCPLDVAIAPSPISEVFERPSGGLSYAVYVRLLSRRRCMVEYVAMKVPWDDEIVLESPDEKSPICQFGSLQFPLRKVLNLRIENILKFARAGEVVEGVILATGLRRFPEGYTTGHSVPLELSLYDQYGEAIIEQSHLFVQRARRHVRQLEAPRAEVFDNPRVSSSIRRDFSGTTGSVQLTHSPAGRRSWDAHWVGGRRGRVAAGFFSRCEQGTGAPSFPTPGTPSPGTNRRISDSPASTTVAPAVRTETT